MKKMKRNSVTRRMKITLRSTRMQSLVGIRTLLMMKKINVIDD